MRCTRGFSLVELSIVLVILGLLVGGVLGGQALIRSSEIRSLIVDKDKYITAVQTFKNKYNGLAISPMPQAFGVLRMQHPPPALPPLVRAPKPAMAMVMVR